MIVSYKRSAGENGLDSRIAQLSSRRTRIDDNSRAPVEVPENTPEPSSELESAGTADSLATAREELMARLAAEISPGRKSVLSRSDLAKLVNSAAQTYFGNRAISLDLYRLRFLGHRIEPYAAMAAV